MQKKILLFSYNPVPTSQYKTVEGSALRFWRMALSLKEKGCKDLTIAVWRDFPQSVNKHQGINIINFDDDENKLQEIVSKYDVVIVSAAMGTITTKIRRSASESTRVIVDAYSPLYVEFLTKSLDKNEDEAHLSHYQGYVEEFNRALLEADNILISSDNQKHFYRGVLGGLCSLLQHDDSRFVMLPAMVEEDPGVTQRVEINDKIKLLWFGGIYPWFDLEDIIDVFSYKDIRDRCTLTIVGGANPFYPKDSKRYNGKYIRAFERAQELSLIDEGIITFEDWVEYGKRVDLFNRFDIAISLNNIGLENDYSFRLRIADMAGNGLPVITNGGDVLGESLINNNAAFRLESSDKNELKRSLSLILTNRKNIQVARKRLRTDIYSLIHINTYIDNLISAIEVDGELNSRNNHSIYIDSLDQWHSHNIHNIPNQRPLKSLTYSDIAHVSTKNLIELLKKRTIKKLQSLFHDDHGDQQNEK